jgi:hypothetical protein
MYLIGKLLLQFVIVEPFGRVLVEYAPHSVKKNKGSLRGVALHLAIRSGLVQDISSRREEESTKQHPGYQIEPEQCNTAGKCWFSHGPRIATDSQLFPSMRRLVHCRANIQSRSADGGLTWPDGEMRVSGKDTGWDPLSRRLLECVVHGNPSDLTKVGEMRRTHTSAATTTADTKA